jgi:hypothetical protein
MKTLSAALLLATLSLGGCCLSGSGCNGPMATGRYDLDGLGQPPAEDPPPAAPKQRLSSRTKSHGDEMRSLYDNSDGRDNFEDDDARLRRKLIICQGCAVSGN